MENGRHTIRREYCGACGLCVAVCFAEALKIYGDSVTPEELAKIVVRDKAFFDNSGGGLTVSGGEPLLQAGFVAELFGIVKPQGIHTAVDTSGAVPRAAVERVMPLTDLFLYDFKQPDPEKHLAGTGARNRRIIENLFFISDQGKAVEIRIPLIPGYNDSEAGLRSAAEILRKVKSITRTVLLPYYDYAKTKYAALGMGDTMPRAESPADEDLRRAAGILQSFGVNAVSGKD
jgi:pyruvate formate lyase activating enzyme